MKNDYQVCKSQKLLENLRYKETLDKQINEDRKIREMNKVSNIDTDGKLLPSYAYAIPPTPVYRKAKDSFNRFKCDYENKNKINQLEMSASSHNLNSHNENHQ